ncbi:ww domain-containing protein [Curvularia clavata]|uniref:Ww domain-containing protein n=1 Tax=Curvularia clavata TaxID=95742 RepID=A0A9Q8YZF3_CURCL|nr:ww domain-containing protein [Curvularia clavata]
MRVQPSPATTDNHRQPRQQTATPGTSRRSRAATTWNSEKPASQLLTRSSAQETFAMASKNDHQPPPAATTQPGDRRSSAQGDAAAAPGKRDASYTYNNEAPLPYDDSAPPLPDEPAPDAKNNGWEPRWDPTSQAYYYFNHFTGVSQWECPRELETAPYPHNAYDTHNPHDRTYASGMPAMPSGYPVTSSAGAAEASSRPPRKWGGYNPAIHGSYDPNADYAKAALEEEEEEEKAAAAAAHAPYGAAQDYSATAQFNRFTGKFQQAGNGPELHNDENKSKRQMNAFFDVNAAANSHDGRSLKAERRAKPITKQQIQAYKEKRKQKKDKKRMEFLLS